MSAPTRSPRLGDRLLEAGLITDGQLELALREQKRTSRLLGEVLQDLGFVNATDLASLLGADAQTATADLRELEATPELANALPEPDARRLRCVPMRAGARWQVAFANPFDCLAVDEVESHLRARVEVLAAPANEIEGALDRIFGHEEDLQALVDRLIAGSTEEQTAGAEPMLVLIEKVLNEAISRGASDVHFEPDEKILRVRMRCDGVLRPLLLLPRDLSETVIARLKVLSNLDLSESRLPQDGRFAIQTGQHATSLRVSTLPTRFGESVVVRILEQQSGVLKIEDLGLAPEPEQQLRKSVEAAQGIILVTGPTGSGKTTTLYAALQAIDRKTRSVFTLEDPIEYPLAEVRQSQINEKANFTFARGLRALLRQDPDVLLVGETRDPETAQLLARAALTGHLVLSSLHTQDSFSAITRLLDLGVEPYLLAPTLRMIVAQRLARRLCEHCRTPDGRGGFRAVGCDQCGHSGYRGRVGFYEVLPMNDQYEEAILNHNMVLLRKLALAEGVRPLREAGLDLVEKGITTREEILRVAE